MTYKEQRKLTEKMEEVTKAMDKYIYDTFARLSEKYGFALDEALAYIKTPVEKISYSAAEVSKMSDEDLLDNFSKITKKKMLSCSHCHSDNVEIERFVHQIRRWCLKKKGNGLVCKMSLPKTCDYQAETNRKRQPYYTQLKNARSETIVSELKHEHIHLFKQPGGKNQRRKVVIKQPTTVAQDSSI